MKKTRLAFCVIALIFLGITFSSCGEKVILPSSTISLTMTTNQDGSISQDIAFSTQTEKLKSLNIEESMIRQTKSRFLENLNVLRNEFYINFLLISSLSPSDNFKIGKNIIVGEPKINNELDIAHFSIVYDSIQAFQYFQTGKTVQSDQLLGKSLPIKFLSHAESEGRFPFAAQFTNSANQKRTIGERYLDIYSNCFSDLPTEICLQLDMPSFIYDYATPFTNLRSNADLQFSNNGIFHNVWIRNRSNYETCVIKLSSTVVYSGWWYLSLLICAIFIFGIGLLIIKFKK